MEASMLATSRRKPSKKIDKGKQRQLARHTTSLVVSDAAILIVEIFQILGLIQSMSLKWSYPETWLKYANFILLFNIDVWDFIKVRSGAYAEVQGLETPSSDVPVCYNHILIAWGILLLLIAVIFVSTYLILRHRQPPYLMVHNARLERIFLIICQIFSLPLGTAIFRLFHCNEKGTLSVYNSIVCHEGLYWAYIVPALIVLFLLFVLVPLWMILRVRKQGLAASSQHHEEHMKLKEVEYMSGLDVVWVVQGYHLFSSFRFPALFYRPSVHLVKLVLLVIFAVADNKIKDQTIALSVLLSVAALVAILLRPYRVMSFNVALCLSVGCLAGDCIFGAMIAQVTPATVESPWLVEPYSYVIIIAINAILALCLITWIIFMISRRICCKRCYPNDPLWPVLTSYEYEVDGMETYKFMAAVLRGRAVLESCIRATSVFAPVHQLAHQIEIINAYCREAEKTKDGFHTTLLQLLDDMIDAYKRLEPLSLFSETVKDEIRQNAAHFVEFMPGFCHRLAQRDYDMILVNPVKKRLLMKMSIIGMFVNGKRHRPVKDPITQKALLNIWEEQPDIVDIREEVEYRENLYPEPPVGPDLEAMYMADAIYRPIELMDLEDSDEEESLAAFLKRVPPVLVIKDEQSRRNSCASLVIKDLVALQPKEQETSLNASRKSLKAEELEVETAPRSDTAPVAESVHGEPLLSHTSGNEEEVETSGLVNESFVPDDEAQQERSGEDLPHTGNEILKVKPRLEA